jgi:predicted secreted protein
MSSAKAAFGSILKRVATAVAELTSITVGGQKLNLIEVSNMDSASGYAEFIAGFADGGEFSCEGNFLNSGAQALIISDHQAKTLTSWVVLLGVTPTATITANCFVTALDFSAKFDDKLGFSATLKITGKPVYS